KLERYAAEQAEPLRKTLKDYERHLHVFERIDPKNTVLTHYHLGRARGKMKNSDMVMLAVRSKVDRLLARG
ncbi:MAG: hypothetical protein R6X34_16720, partial [Chloroflexota bacterium]